MKPELRALVARFLPRAIYSQRIWAGPLRGAGIVTSWHDYPAAILGRTERPLLAWFARNVRPGETWLDVGAHYGYTAIALCRLVGTHGRVFAFEPMLRTAGCVAQTRRINRLAQLTVVPFALASPETIEVARLAVVRGMADRTLTDRVAASPGAAASGQESMLAARLDWLWPRICGERAQIDGIKIDVQGMELEALRGMLELLTTHRPKVVVEIHSGVDREALLSLLKTAGYSADAVPIEPIAGETQARYVDDHSYAFLPR